MAFQVSLQRLAQLIDADIQVPSGHDPSQVQVLGVSTDTRLIQAEHVFLALQGERFDGHQFAEQALNIGAVGVIGQVPMDLAGPQLLVQDTLRAYQKIAHWWRQNLGLPIVAITGSVGKTTTKELIAAALATHGSILKTRANYNNEIGVPKTLLELDDTHQYGVIEMGMRAKGEIALLTQIARPNIALITNVGTAHIGRLGSEQAIANAKCELLAELAPDGIAVLNHDNERLINTAKGVWSGQQLTFGLTGGDIHGYLLDSDQVEVKGVTLPLPLPGKHNALNLLAAIAVMEALNLDWRHLQKGLTVDLPGGRANRLTLPNDIVILDETYNAGVESMRAALHLLKETPGKRHIAVLGTMKELGQHSLNLHQQVGNTVRELAIDYLLVIADPSEAQALTQGANPIPTKLFTSQADLVSHLISFLQSEDCVLFKASRSVGLDQVLKQLVSNLSPNPTQNE